MSDIEMSVYERHQKIIRLIESRGKISLSEICEQFGVSEATARRDLEALSEKDFIRRVRGGLILEQQAAPEDPILMRSRDQEFEKERIGRAAAALVEDGETIFLGSGTTVLEAANHLVNRKITVITNSLPVIMLFQKNKNISLIALGGIFRDSELSFIGHITEQALSELRADKVIMGIRAISVDQGLTNDYLPETLTDRAILQIGKKNIVVADHTKCGFVSTAFVAPITEMNLLVTDNQADPLFIDAIKNMGVEVVVV